ncbi:hypothetical protein HO173_010245 [Letharia columbiana]|uniref:Uncharacterized protein n=1 Tax=Letharia columbiana TaxID=112416 RepID=A0A8H6FN38_9LECA|nr:uncharacterized protein HO173_010245 [Letharia columbiana]KAF6231493.1 hypothetical protein HO173_010245 [Letharia columbiana]
MLPDAMAPMRICTLIFTLASSLVWAAPHGSSASPASRQSTEKLVFCHFMIGVVDDRTSASDYDNDMQQAKAAGIDAFALNIGIDGFTSTQLDFAYESAHSNGMSVFISFDFNWYSTSNTSGIADTIGTYAGYPAQLLIDSKVFVSSFSGDGLDLAGVQSDLTAHEIFWAPNFQPNNIASADALFNWMAWPNNGDNKAPDAGNNLTVSEGDTSYTTALKGKPYVAPVSPWFSTHFGLEVKYSKNWVFPSDLLWFDRWTEILNLGSQFVEIQTWNDYGESHYVGPLSSPHIDDGNSKWTNDMPHDGFLQMAKPYIAAFHAGSKTVDSHIESDQLIYWYRPTLKSASCGSTDNCEQPWPSPTPNPNYFTGKPNGYDTMEDSVFVIALLTSPGSVTVTSGANGPETFGAPAGASSWQVGMGTGKQSFSLTRNGQKILSGDSLKDIISDCVCGIYNFNAYVGTLPAGASDPLSADGLRSFTNSLSATCQPTPSLGTATGAGTGVVAVPTAVGTNSSALSMIGGTGNSTSSGSGGPQPSAVRIAVSPLQGSGATSSSAVAGAPATTSQTPTTTSSTTAAIMGSGSKTITALSQLFPTNCMHAGFVWGGPPGSDPAAWCNGG